MAQRDWVRVLIIPRSIIERMIRRERKGRCLAGLLICGRWGVLWFRLLCLLSGDGRVGSWRDFGKTGRNLYSNKSIRGLRIGIGLGTMIRSSRAFRWLTLGLHDYKKMGVRFCKDTLRWQFRCFAEIHVREYIPGKRSWICMNCYIWMNQRRHDSRKRRLWSRVLRPTR